MTDEPDYDPVDCPVEGCSFVDAPRAVAAHVSGTHDDRHDWDALPHDGARAFVLAEKRKQLDAMGAEIPGDGGSSVERSEGGTSASTATPPTSDDAGAATADNTGATGVDREPAGTGREQRPLDTSFADDAMAVLSLLRRYDTTDLSDLDTFRLVNLYALVSDLRSSAESARKAVRDALLEEIQDDREVPGDYGTVKRHTYESHRLKEEETVRAALARAGIDPVAVMSLDGDKIEDAVEAGRLDEDAVFDTEERASIRRVSVAEERRDELLADLDPELRSLLERVR